MMRRNSESDGKRISFTRLLLMILLILIGVSCAFAPIITSHDPNEVILMSIDEAPSSEHLLGCDYLGRDIFSRLLYGGRVSVAVGISVALMQLTIGVGLGMIAGYFGGLLDIILVKISELIQCFPFFILAISLVSIVGSGFFSVIIILGLLGWPSIFFLLRSETIKLREREYVIASRYSGASSFRILHRHIFPNIKHLIFVQVTISMSSAILSESSLSFLGMGIMPPNSSWGNILMSARTMSVLENNWWQWLPAGLCVFVVVLSINLLAKEATN